DDVALGGGGCGERVAGEAQGGFGAGGVPAGGQGFEGAQGGGGVARGGDEPGRARVHEEHAEGVAGVEWRGLVDRPADEFGPALAGLEAVGVVNDDDGGPADGWFGGAEKGAGKGEGERDEGEAAQGEHDAPAQVLTAAVGRFGGGEKAQGGKRNGAGDATAQQVQQQWERERGDGEEEVGGEEGDGRRVLAGAAGEVGAKGVERGFVGAERQRGEAVVGAEFGEGAAVGGEFFPVGGGGGGGIEDEVVAVFEVEEDAGVVEGEIDFHGVGDVQREQV